MGISLYFYSMRKYLINSATALLFGVFVTSCAHDTDFDNSTRAGQSVLDKYETVFTTAFGTPAPNQTWGFGESTANSRANTRSMTRAYTSSFNFASIAPTPADADYIENAPSGTTLLRGYLDGTSFHIDSSVNDASQIQPNGSNLAVYVKGEVTLNANCNLYLPANTKLYLTKGSKLTLPAGKDYSFGQSGVKIYIYQGAELKCDGKLQLASTATIYNRGTVTVRHMEVTNAGVLYNQGDVNATDQISVENWNSVIVNEGDITSKYLHTAGSGHFKNISNVTITSSDGKGTTLINSNNNTWLNEGTYTTDYFEYHGGSDDVINNCLLTVNHDFNMNLGQNMALGFKISNGGGVLVKGNLNAGGPINFTDIAGTTHNYSGGPFNIWMEAGSVFKVEGEAHLNATKQDFGIYGPSSGDNYAVFQANTVIQDQIGEANITYGGKLGVVANTHFAQGKSGQYDYIYYKNGCSANNIYAPGFNTGNLDVSINSGKCNPGFNGGGGGNVPSSLVVRIIAEDLTVGSENGDFDFNDVVFDVLLTNNNTKVKITLKAAGGTLPLYVAKHEVHEEYGVSTGTMVNTGRGITKGDVSFTIDNTFNSTDIKVVAKAIPVEVLKLVNGSQQLIELTAPVGKAAAKVAVDDTYEWCTERQSIDDKYYDTSLNKGKFSMYVQKLAPYAEDNSWYK